MSYQIHELPHPEKTDIKNDIAKLNTLYKAMIEVTMQKTDDNVHMHNTTVRLIDTAIYNLACQYATDDTNITDKVYNN